MRYRSLRFDIWVCLLLAYLVSLLPVKLMEEVILPRQYAAYVQAHTVEAGEIGGKAGPEVFRAQSVDDLLTHDTFTIVSPGIQYRNRGAGFYNGWYMYAVTLPSGELVAAILNMDAVQNSEESIYSGEATLPVGRVMYEDLSADETFMKQISYAEPLSRTDFYVDMVGNGGKVSQEDYTQTPTTVVQLATAVVCFALLHTLGSKVGIFPPFFSRRKEQESEWE